MKKISKKEAEEKIKFFFSEIKNKNPKEIKKIKRLASNKKISLKEKRKLFCKKCLNPYSGKEYIKIKKNLKTIKCKNCNYTNRLKIK